MNRPNGSFGTIPGISGTLLENEFRRAQTRIIQEIQAIQRENGDRTEERLIFVERFITGWIDTVFLGFQAKKEFPEQEKDDQGGEKKEEVVGGNQQPQSREPFI
jgi:hypothetical protein